jgi:hypothetical protein
MNKYDLREGSSIKVRSNTGDDIFDHYNVKGVFDGRAFIKDNEPGMIVTVVSSPVRTFAIEDCIPCKNEDICKPFHDKITSEN